MDWDCVKHFYDFGNAYWRDSIFIRCPRNNIFLTGVRMSNIIDFFEYKRRKQQPVAVVNELSPVEVMQGILASVRFKKNQRSKFIPKI